MDSSSLLEIALWTIVAIFAGLIINRVRKIGKPQPYNIMAEQNNTSILKGPVDLKEFTPSDLKQHDGSDPNQPLYFSVLGKVYDVSAGRSFYGPGGPYANFAGHECARYASDCALATMSTNPKDIGSPSLDGLGAEEKETLDQWISKFDAKYPHIGNLATAKN